MIEQGSSRAGFLPEDAIIVARRACASSLWSFGDFQVDHGFDQASHGRGRPEAKVAARDPFDKEIYDRTLKFVVAIRRPEPGPRILSSEH